MDPDKTLHFCADASAMAEHLNRGPLRKKKPRIPVSEELKCKLLILFGSRERREGRERVGKGRGWS